VQLVGGSYAAERVRIENPEAVAQNWERLGFGRLHLVDLDAATGRGSNRNVVRTILGVNGLDVQCGGGVRDLDAIDELLDAGASEVVLGTRAIEDRAWLEEVVVRFPNRIIVAADTRGRQVVTRGWSVTDSRNVLTFVADLSTLPLAAILVTAVDKEGRMEGPDIALMQELALWSRVPLQASGGIRNVEDIRALAELGVSGAIIGMALYTGALDPQTIIEEFV
jgi:phosphoribosylformimino-5-aminoimidazole carboxamide ribotide isomerase